MRDVLLIGEPMVMFYANDLGSIAEAPVFSKGLAGAEVNVGIGLARLGHQVGYMTKLSTDELGKYIYAYLEREKLASDYVTFDSTKQVGLMFKNKVLTGDPDTLYYRKGSAASTLSVAEVDQLDLTGVKVLHMTGIPPALSLTAREACFHLMEKAKAAGCYITFDPNLRPALWESQEMMIETLNRLSSYANLVLPGMAEGQLLTNKETADDIAEFYLKNGSAAVVIKLGGEGAFVKKQESDSFIIPGFDVTNIIDTVGAGDGFAVGVISGYLDGLTLEASVRQANAIGAIQIQDASDNEALPTPEELSHYLMTQLK